MAKERDEYLDDMESLFGHPGWRHIEADAKRQIYELQAEALEAKTWDKVNELRGRAISLNEVLMLPQVVANARDAHERDD